MKAGRRLFTERGVAGVNSNEIARAAGVATGTFYVHFANKQELFRAISRDVVEELRAVSDSLVAKTDGSPESEARILARVLLDFAEDNRRLVRVAFGPEGVGAGVVQCLMEVVLADLHRRAERRLGSGSGPSPVARELAIQATAAMWVRAATWWCDHGDSADRDEVIGTLVRLTLATVAEARSEPRVESG